MSETIEYFVSSTNERLVGTLTSTADVSVSIAITIVDKNPVNKINKKVILAVNSSLKLFHH